jgi:uncharacterized SAM-binding protein YcdF (DUF218 family)
VSDGVVVLTGASNVRLEAATKLLEAGKGKRLLISGVNREASREDVLGVTKAVRPIYECCVDLGYAAADTIGNASETAEWAKAKDYQSLIVVTADYHMPRSMLELHAAMPDVTLHPYPVVTESLNAHRWWKGGTSARRMTVEYCKYLAILGREAFLSWAQGKGRSGTGEGSVLIYLRSFLFQLFFWLWSVVWAIGMIADLPLPAGSTPGRCRPGPRA